MKNVYIYSHNPQSASAKSLAQSLSIQRIKHEGSSFKGNLNKTVINWGSSVLPDEVKKCNVINTHYAVDTCANKIKFFKAVNDQCNHPDWTNSSEVAKEWLSSGAMVFARTTLRGSGGLGIIELSNPDEMVRAPLYTKYIPKKNEYRVHILAGNPFLVQRKAFSGGEQAPAGVNWRIRNHDNGFIFARNEGADPEDGVIDESLKAFNLIKGLTFGSVDVIYNKYRKKAYVLEINTASGLQGSTADDYMKVFKEYLSV